MDFRQLEYFRAIVDAGSLSGAARKLNMTQPPLSLAITKLETELGVSLLERTAKGVQPTSAGRYLLAAAVRILARRDRVTATLSMMGQGIVGELRVGVEPMVISEVVSEAMAAILSGAPGVRITLRDTTPTEILNGVLRGELDVGVVPFAPATFANFVHEECDYEAIAEIPVCIAVPEGRQHEEHKEGHGWGRWVLPARQPAFPGMPEAVETALGRELRDVVEVSTPATALPLVAAGIGVSISPTRLAEQAPGVGVVEAPSWLLSMRATAIWQRDAEMTPLMRRWLDTLREVGAARRRRHTRDQD